MDLEVLEQQIQRGNLKGCYVIYGPDENLIKEYVNSIIDAAVDKNFAYLNLVKFDGMKVQFDEVMNACETMPFMSDKKVVVIYRTAFLGEVEDRENKKKFEEIYKYISNLPPYCILVMYYVFGDDREKASTNVKKLEKICSVIKADKLKGDKLYKRVAAIFEQRGKSIDKVLLKFFCDNVENNMDIIKNEVDKLISYTEGRDITKKDIIELLPDVNDDDIFDLVDYLSQKRPEKAIDILNELLFRGEAIGGILFMIVRQFKLLYSIKLGVDEGKNKDALAKELKLHPYVCEKLIAQSRKFSLNQIKHCLKLCLETEKSLKSSTGDKKLEMEMLIINTIRG
ncbi:DNA polymerase III subunit delta [Clostridium thermarum]|uniref:DNA polymerase III subunit delta n=1 Tax=Clostridium thermarum TaxID=1716543 RepID=UPI00111F17AA|nr:DNA polymerase III subunit delta [Clostridium thermarum]